MFCPGCGKQVQEEDNFCPHCDRRLQETISCEDPGAKGAAAAAIEQVLFSFGPFGMDVCNGPYKVFGKWHRRNSVIVELTNTRLRALPNRRFGLLTIPAFPMSLGTELPFEIPYDQIVSVNVQRHPSPVALMIILDIEYREGGVLKEKCVASYKKNIQRAYQIITASCQGNP